MCKELLGKVAKLTCAAYPRPAQVLAHHVPSQGSHFHLGDWRSARLDGQLDWLEVQWVWTAAATTSFADKPRHALLGGWAGASHAKFWDYSKTGQEQHGKGVSNHCLGAAPWFPTVTLESNCDDNHVSGHPYLYGDQSGPVRETDCGRAARTKVES